MNSSLRCIKALGEERFLTNATLPVLQLRVLQIAYYQAFWEPELGGPIDIILAMARAREKFGVPIKVLGIQGLPYNLWRFEVLKKHVFYLTVDQDTCHHIFQSPSLDL